MVDMADIKEETMRESLNMNHPVTMLSKGKRRKKRKSIEPSTHKNQKRASTQLSSSYHVGGLPGYDSSGS